MHRVVSSFSRCALLITAGRSRADVVYSNLSTPVPTSFTIAGQDGSFTYEIADAFTSS